MSDNMKKLARRGGRAADDPKHHTKTIETVLPPFPDTWRT